MAEENTADVKTESGFDEAKIAEIIKSNMSTSFKEMLAAQAQQQSERVEEPPAQQQQQAEPDFWDTIINPKVDGKVAGATIAAQAAEDKVDFYSSDEWLEEVDEWLTEDDPAKRKEEKQQIREQIESTFKNMLKAGKGTFRRDIYSYVLGEKIKKDKIKYQESIGRRSKAKEDNELTKARKAVDITTGNVSNFSASDIHKMSHEKMLEELGSLQF